MSQWDSDKQIQSHNRLMTETGYCAFSGTSLTVECPTIMGKAWSFLITPKTQPSVYERFYSDGVITSQGLTVTRQVIPIILQCLGDDAVHVSSNNVSLLPIGVVPVAAYLKRVRYFNKTKNGGTPLINIGDTRCYVTGKTYDHTGGNVEKEITGTAGDYSNLSVGDKVWLIGDNLTNGIYTVASVATDGSYITVSETVHTGDDTNVGVSTYSAYISDEEAKAAPASGALSSITAATDFADNAYPLVPAGAVLVASTTGGSSSAPSGVMVQVELEVPATSGLEMFYSLQGW